MAPPRSQSAKTFRTAWLSLALGWIAYCGYCLFVDRRDLNELKLEAARLQKLVGPMDITDDDMIHVVNVVSDGPGEFLWHIYLPAGFSWNLSLETAASGGGSTARGARN